MQYDVVPIGSSYRGIGRSIADKFFKKGETRENANYLIETYLSYIEDTLKPENQEIFEHMLSYCDILKSHDIPCEVIAYDLHPLESAYGRPLAFLGIDIVKDMAESLLECGAEKVPRTLLNEYLLCKRASDVPLVTTFCDTGGMIWLPCWVYRVL